MKKIIFLSAIALVLFATQSCRNEAPVEIAEVDNGILQVELDPVEVDVSFDNLSADWKEKLGNIQIVNKYGNNVTVTIESVEYYTLGSTGHMGNATIFSNTGNKQSSLDFVPGDPTSSGGDMTVYAVDQVDGATTSGLSGAATEAAIDNAMATWDGLSCSDPMMAKNVAVGDIGFIQWVFANFFGVGSGGSPARSADIQHAGFLPGAFFETAPFFPPGGSTFILAATFTLAQPDITGDGEFDLAFREIYYNDNFAWAIGQTIDVETIALHEAGHGLSQAHFGKGFVKQNGDIQFAPKAVMNSTYLGGVQHTLLGTDNAGHCSLWANWPVN